MSKLLEFILDHEDQFRRARLPSLYSDFTPQRSSNPDGFAANVAAWQDALEKASRAGVLPAYTGSISDTLSLHVGEALLQALETKEWGRPLSLGTVINESISRRRMIPYQDFTMASRSIHIRDWKVQPRWLLLWGLKQLGALASGSGAGSLPRGQFVVIANVEHAAGKVIAKMGTTTNHVGRILPMRTFRDEASNAMELEGPMSESDLTILLKTLARDKDIIIYDDEVVKIKIPGDNSDALSMEDKTIASLKVLIADLNIQVDDIVHKIDDLTAAAHDAIGRKDRTLALATLKSKKVHEATLVQRTDMLSQLEKVFHGIEQAHDQVAAIRIMQGSTVVLRNLRAQTGGLEKVEDIVEELRDEMEQVDEIGSAMEVGEQSSILDEDAVDQELDQMLQQAKIEEEEQEAHRTQQRLEEIEVNKTKKPQPVDPGVIPVDVGVDALQHLLIDEDPSNSGNPSISTSRLIESAPGG